MQRVEQGSAREAQGDVRALEEAARQMRALNLIAIHAAGSGHPGGTLSVMDVCAVLYLHEARLDPKRPDWEERDRIFFSAGHKAPALYVSLARAGFFPCEDVVTLRKLGSPFQGHPHASMLPGIEVSSGSLGQGLGVATGCAWAARLAGASHRVYAIMGDGEQQEGSVWEAAMAAGAYGLDNLCAVIDRNHLQIDGRVADVMDIEPLGDKYRAFNWHVVTCDGHDIQALLDAFAEARVTKGRPTVIIAGTVKGKGVSFMEDAVAWHGVATKNEAQLDQALRDVGAPGLDSVEAPRVRDLLLAAAAFQPAAARMPRGPATVESGAASVESGAAYAWNASPGRMEVDMEPTRFGFGRALRRIGDDERIVAIHADISASIKISDFTDGHPERERRVLSVGIAEQNMMQVAAGLALQGRIPITGTYGVFAAGRAWDQIRTTICYDRLNVKIAGAHGGVSVGADGATHQALEELALMAVLPNMTVVVPCDSVETDRLTRAAVLDVQGPAYIRFGREATPVVTSGETPLVLGRANVVRFRRSAPRFADAFETMLAAEYAGEDEDLTLVACGAMVPESMRAAWMLEEQDGIRVRVLNVHTVKPLDADALVRAARETGVMLTCEEHQRGGFGSLVAGVVCSGLDYEDPLLFDMLGVEDRFGESGDPRELMDVFGLSAEHIASRAMALLGRRPRARTRC